MHNVDELLFLGEDVCVGDIPIKQYSLINILKMDKNYRTIVSRSVMKPIDFFQRRNAKKSEIDKLNMLDMLIVFYYDENRKSLVDDVVEMIEFVTGLDWKFYAEIGEFVHFASDGNDKRLTINSVNYNDVMAMISKVYHVKKHDPYEKYGNYDMADDETKEVIDMLIEEEQDEINDSNITFQSILESVACNSDSGLNIFNIKNATVYQLFRCFYRIEQNYTYKNTMTGLYSGCIDSKKINMEDISWAKKIQVD